MIEVLKRALTDAKRNERHNNVAETRYWLNQYKLIAEQAIAELESQEPVAWIEGYPKAHYAEEWFIAKLNDGDRVVLQALPEEFKHDFTTRDGTYFLKESIKSWMQFPDTEFLPPPQRTWQGLTDEEMYLNCPNWLSQEQCKAWIQQIEAKLKQKNGFAEEKNT